MTKRIRLIAIILIAVMFALVAACVGATAAIWTSSTPGSGNTIAPATDSPENWNAWAKYFSGTVISADLHTATVTSFHSDDYGLNLETVIIPINISVDGKDYKVTEIGNRIFADNTLKELPVTVYIPPTVTHISAMAFASLPNLTKVVFGVDKNGQGETCVVDDFAFMMSSRLNTVITNGRSVVDASGNALTGLSLAFSGCDANLSIIENLQN